MIQGAALTCTCDLHEAHKKIYGKCTKNGNVGMIHPKMETMKSPLAIKILAQSYVTPPYRQRVTHDCASIFDCIAKGLLAPTIFLMVHHSFVHVTI